MLKCINYKKQKLIGWSKWWSNSIPGGIYY